MWIGQNVFSVAKLDIQRTGQSLDGETSVRQRTQLAGTVERLGIFQHTSMQSQKIELHQDGEDSKEQLNQRGQGQSAGSK